MERPNFCGVAVAVGVAVFVASAQGDPTLSETLSIGLWPNSGKVPSLQSVSLLPRNGAFFDLSAN
jgi:hypothetical protein